MASKQKLTPESREKLDRALLDLAEFTNVFETDVKRAALVAATILENVEREHADPASEPATTKSPPAVKQNAPRSKAVAGKTSSRSRTHKTAAKK